jgi:hypothetical protein
VLTAFLKRVVALLVFSYDGRPTTTIGGTT